MPQKKFLRTLAALMAAALLTGCGTAQAPAPSDSVPTETTAAVTEAPVVTEAPAVTEATMPELGPVINDPSEQHYQTFGQYFCIHNDGTVSIQGDGLSFTKLTTPGWTDIVSVVYDYPNFVGLRSDGTIVTTDPENETYQVMGAWKNIVSIYCDYDHGILGLRADGKVFCTDEEFPVTQWEGIVQLASGSGGVYGLKEDGTVVAPGSAIGLSGWTDVTQLVSGTGFLAGLRRDGTVLLTSVWGDSETDSMKQQKKEVSGWKNIVKLSAYNELMALRSDGTVLVTTAQMIDSSDADASFSRWKNVVDIDQYGARFMGLRSDGTVLSYSDIEPYRQDVKDLKNIKAISAEGSSALMADGTLLYITGDNDLVPEDVSLIIATDVRIP